MIPSNPDCASLVSARNRDVKKMVSWILAAESVSGLMTCLLVLFRSISIGSSSSHGLSETLVGLGEVVPTWPIGSATNYTFHDKADNDATKGVYLSVFSCSFEWHPKSLQKPISMRMRLHCFRSKSHGFNSGVSGIPLAYIRSGAVP